MQCSSADDFCLWAPPSKGTIGDTERDEVAWCTKSGRGTRTIPNGALKGVHFVKTPDYIQVSYATYLPLLRSDGAITLYRSPASAISPTSTSPAAIRECSRSIMHTDQ